ncbi:hypothetical protein [Thalassobius sp. Cn5-15]|uniref:hypothetical protein n=1 Tax=Thalassobius sp. Cn5-15 TaxID=2917763 RepID=UPI001EF262C5|nr:hypothetical protein [Thalassobius sp. Cn5-15]MCG7492015.1 hypothetical protein [Thalassobius sp. Cn5-15]
MIPDSFRETGLFFQRAHDVPLTHFQVFGERASATNLVRKLIDKNLNIVRTESLGWKHAAPHMVAIPRDFLMVAVVRNAEPWALSMHKRPWHLDPQNQAYTFGTFLRSQWRGIVDREADFEEVVGEMTGQTEGLELQFDRHPITGRAFENLFDLRNVKMATLLGMLNRDCNILLVRAETVQNDPEAFIEWVKTNLDLSMRRPFFKPVNRRLGNRFNLSVSLEERGETPVVLSPEDRAYMLSKLDLEQEASLGYHYDKS